MTSRHIMPRLNNKAMNMKTNAIIAAIGLSLALVSSAWATQGNPEAAKEKAKVCAACHGPDGNSITPSFPKLAGQNEDYLRFALKHYRNKQRTNAIMNGQAESLTDKQIADLAAFYAKQKGLVLKR